METKTKAATREQREADQLDAQKELQNKQMAAHNGEQEIEMIPANLDKKHQIKAYNKDYVHVFAYTRNWNEATKEVIEDTKTIVIQPNNIDQLIATGAFNGYDDVKVIHDPRPSKPKEYKLKTTEPALKAPGIENDAALAAKEQKLAEREKRLAEQEARLDAKIAKLEKGSQATTASGGTELPDLDLGQDVGTTKTKPAPAQGKAKQ